MLEYLKEQLGNLLLQRDALNGEVDAILAAPKTEKRDLNDGEASAFNEKRAAVTALSAQIDEARTNVEAAQEDVTRAARAAAVQVETRNSGTPKASGFSINEALTYERGNGASYFLDLARSQVSGDRDASARLARHGQEMNVELPAREARRTERARSQARGIGDLSERGREGMFEQRVNPNRTDGQGGYFVPPLWVMDEYIDLPRFARTTANLCQNFDLPGGTDSINLPKIATGTTVAAQAADAGVVSSTDATDTFVNAPVRTIAGQQDVAIQLLDQSPVAFDQIIFADLINDYNAKLDVQVLNGSGSSGQLLGILNVSGINAITYTDASVTLPEMYPAFAQAAAQVFKNRKMAATAAVVLPSTWYWATGQLDTTNRPLITPPQVSFNPAGTANGVAVDDTPAGMLSMGLPAYMDGNMPSNLGAGTNETRAIVARFPDLYLWEGPLQTRVINSVLSGTLQVRLQMYRYVAFMAGRRPEAVSVISGTGMIPQAGY